MTQCNQCGQLITGAGHVCIPYQGQNYPQMQMLPCNHQQSMSESNFEYQTRLELAEIKNKLYEILKKLEEKITIT